MCTRNKDTWSLVRCLNLYNVYLNTILWLVVLTLNLLALRKEAFKLTKVNMDIVS